MPVTVKLSERFYQKFGHDLVGELVDWFNQMDTTYRSDLRELNDVNFARFDAKLEQRLAQFESKLEQRMAGLETKLEQRMAGLETKLEQRMAGLETKLVRWMFVFWIGQAATTVGLVLAVVRLR
jgi:uncharacterized coiled-coil protein SlyX